MAAISRLTCGHGSWGTSLTATLLTALFSSLISLQPATAQPAREDGLFVSVPSPISSDVVDSIRAKTLGAIDRGKRNGRSIRTVVFDFNPGPQPGGLPSSTTDYGACRALAVFIRDLEDLTTVAFLRNDVTAHSVLPVLACRDIVMSSDAHLGDVSRGLKRPLEKDELHFYEALASRRARSPALILKMANKDIEVLEGTFKLATRYIDKSKLLEETRSGVIVNKTEPVLPAGNPGFYSATQALRFSICNLIKDSRQDVAEAYQLTATSLREDPLEGREPKVVRLFVSEPISKAVSERLRRQIRQAIGRQHANVIVLQMESSGGDTQVALELAEYLRTLRDDRGDLPVMTIAYVPEKAPGAATIVGLGCTEIDMGPKSEIGDFEGSFKGNDTPERNRLLLDALVDLAKSQGYPPLLIQGMLDKQLTIYQVQSQKGNSEWKLITGEEWDVDRPPNGPGHWGRQTLVKQGGPNGKLLKLNADLARQLGLANKIVETFADLNQQSGFKDTRDIGHDFLYKLAEFLTHPAVSIFLIVVGVACLFLELKMTGVGLPGVVAALCFVLYFWAHSQLAGQITMLAILLFVLGLILLGLEIFVLPGFGVPGISGIILIILGLALATLDKKPETYQEWVSFGYSLSGVGVGLLGALVVTMAVAWHLPNIPYANRLILKPPTEGSVIVDGIEMGPGDGISPDLAALLGAMGVASTTLRPAGIARFGDDFIDVVAEGSFVNAGCRVQVIEIEGNRVVVKEV